VERHEVTRKYCLKVVERLRRLGFTVTENVRFRGQTFAYVAERTVSATQRIGIDKAVFIIAEFNNVDAATLREYSKTCYAYASSGGKVPRPLEFYKDIECYSVMLAYGVDGAVGHTVRNTEPPKHWTGSEIPVICDLATGQIHYLELTPMRRGLYWDYFRDAVQKVLGADEPKALGSKPSLTVAWSMLADSRKGDGKVEMEMKLFMARTIQVGLMVGIVGLLIVLLIVQYDLNEYSIGDFLGGDSGATAMAAILALFGVAGIALGYFLPRLTTGWHRQSVGVLFWVHVVRCSLFQMAAIAGLILGACGPGLLVAWPFFLASAVAQVLTFPNRERWKKMLA